MNLGDRVLVVREDWDDGGDKVLTGLAGTVIFIEDEEYLPFIEVQLDTPTELHGATVLFMEDELELIKEEFTPPTPGENGA